MKKAGIALILPVLFSYFIMGFGDVVGISTSYVKADFGLSETVAGFLPSMVFLWFLIFSVPVAVAMNRLGRKNMVLVSMVITLIGMVIPLIYYRYWSCMLAFGLLGIGNMVMQVSLNPLLMTVVRKEVLSSMLTVGQVVKALSALFGPFIAAAAVAWSGSWRMLFPVFAITTLLGGVWLLATPIHEQKENQSSTIGNTLALLKDRTIFLLFLGIAFMVGVDVGMNTVAPKILMERCATAIEQAGYGSSTYFAMRTIGSILGAFLLVKISSRLYFQLNMIAVVIAIGFLIWVDSITGVFITIGAIGFFISSIFSVILSMAMNHRPDRANEISGLMIMGVFGGAVAPPLMGFMTDMIGSQVGSVLVILACALYLLFAAFTIHAKENH